MKKIVFVTGSRAEYGIVRKYLKMLHSDRDIDFSIVATSTLVSEEYGNQVKLIYKDGFKVSCEIPLSIDNSSSYGTIKTMSECLEKFGEYFYKSSIDLLIILGDRYEMLSVATAAAIQQIPILHLHGGEATYCNYDEFIRHCITKMSIFHFTSTEEYYKRVIQLGEKPENVFNLGALGAENCIYIDEKNVSNKIKSLEKKGYFVILFHPETLTDVDLDKEITQLLSALSQIKNKQLIFIGSNADTHSDKIRNRIFDYVKNHENAFYYENLHSDEYHYLLKNSICLIGNSSSGIIEVPSLGIYTINIGNRQKGRVRGNSVIDIECDEEIIVNSIKTVLNNYTKITPINPYYKKDTAVCYYKETKNIIKKLNNKIVIKEFYDL